MPRKPMTACAQHGCSALVNGGYCDQHRPAPAARHSEEADRFYSSRRWQEIRAIVRRSQPICMECKKAPSQSVDHINGDVHDNRFDATDPLNSNLRALCNRCHASKTGASRWTKMKAITEAKQQRQA